VSAGVSGGLPYGVYRSLIPGEIKVGWIVVAGGTHKGAVFQERQSSGCRGRKCQWGLGWVMNGAPLSDVIALANKRELLATSRYFRRQAPRHNTPQSAFTCGLDDMAAVNGDAESRAISRDELRPKLITSSTKRRVNELSGLQHQVADDCECL
jgi:hypothetical protein